MSSLPLYFPSLFELFQHVFHLFVFLFLFFLIANFSFWVNIFLSLCFSWFLTFCNLFIKKIKVLISFSIFEIFLFGVFFFSLFFIVSFLIFCFSLFFCFCVFSLPTTIFQKKWTSLFLVFSSKKYVFAHFLYGKLFQKNGSFSNVFETLFFASPLCFSLCAQKKILT